MKINLFINLNVSSSYMLINYQIMNEKISPRKKDDLRRLWLSKTSDVYRIASAARWIILIFQFVVAQSS